jgi:hypothetical protein
MGKNISRCESIYLNQEKDCDQRECRNHQVWIDRAHELLPPDGGPKLKQPTGAPVF